MTTDPGAAGGAGAPDPNAGRGFFGALDSVSNFLRTLLAMAVAGAVGFAGWLGYDHFASRDRAIADLRVKTEEVEKLQGDIKIKDAELETKTKEIATLSADVSRLNEEVKALDKQVKILEVKRKLLKTDHRIAQITVVKQEPDANGQLYTDITFTEQNDEGQPIEEPRPFRLKGDMVYVDYWVVKFDDKYVEEADLLRGTSICLLRRIFSSKQEPDDAFPLDKVNSRPTAYSRGGAPNEFEEKIWHDFWEIANNPERAKELGIREIHGDAVSHKLVPGKKYRLMIRASGGPSIGLEGDAPPTPAPVPGPPSG